METWVKFLKDCPQAVGHDRHKERSDEIEAIQKDKFGEFCQVGYELVVGRKVPAARHPADMSPEESLLARRVDIHLFVGMGMVMAVDGGPPECAALHAQQSQKREEKLDRTGDFVGFVAEVAVVDTGNKKHPDHVEQSTYKDCDGAPSCPDDPEATEMKDDEREETPPFCAFRHGPGLLDPSREVVRINETNQGGERCHRC